MNVKNKLLNFFKETLGALPRSGPVWILLTLSFVSTAEGLRTAAYLDPVGIPTICFGETSGVKLGQTKTRPECERLLQARLMEFDKALTRCLPALPTYPDSTRAALVSWTYNVGPRAACGSTLVRKAKSGDLAGACNELPKWNKATKFGVRVTLPGLTRRRAEERVMCLKGITK